MIISCISLIVSGFSISYLEGKQDVYGLDPKKCVADLFALAEISYIWA